MTRTYDLNGETREISHPEVSDEDVAAQVASFGWDIDHVARDRILCLAKEKAELVTDRAAMFESAARKISELSEQRAELVAELCGIYRTSAMCVEHIEKRRPADLACAQDVCDRLSALLAKHAQPSSEEGGK